MKYCYMKSIHHSRWGLPTAGPTTSACTSFVVDSDLIGGFVGKLVGVIGADRLGDIAEEDITAGSIDCCATAQRYQQQGQR